MEVRGRCRTAVVSLVVVSACGAGAPGAFTERSRLLACGERDVVVIPVERARPDVRSASAAALECLRQRIDQGSAVELDATLLGTEGQMRRFVFRALGDGTFEVFGTVDDRWYYNGDCLAVDWASGIPLPDDCVDGTVDL